MTEQLSHAESVSGNSVNALDVSETLKAEFALLRETPSYANALSGADKQKFTNKSVDRFARYIVCRNYSGLCFELAHLCWAIVNTTPSISKFNADSNKNAPKTRAPGTLSDALFNYFYVSEVVSPSAMLGYFEASEDLSIVPMASVIVETAQAHEQHTGGTVNIHIHQHQFRVHSARANILALCMEWLVTITPNMFESTCNALYGKGYNAIKQLSSQWQKTIYEYLRVHLPSVKAQSKFHYFKQFLQSNQATRFTDQHVLPLWQSLAGREGSERLSTVFKDICQFHEAMDKAKYQQAMDYHDELDDLLKHEHIHSALETHISEQIPLHDLYQTPKLLSKQQASRLQILCDYPVQSVQFPLTVLREGVWGDLQAKCIQAQRNKKLSKSLFIIPTENLYQDMLNKLIAQLEVNEHSYFAVLHILLEREPSLAIELLSANARALNQFVLAKESVNTQELGKLLSGSKQQTQTLAEQLSRNKALVSRCKQAYQQNNRQGFTPESALKDSQVYLQNTSEMLRLSEILIRLNKQYERLFCNASAVHENYRADGSIFCNELLKRMLP